MAPKRVYTKSHLDLEPPKILDDLEKLIRKRSFAESQGSNSALSRENSLPKNFVSIYDIQLELPFEHSLFMTKFESFVDETIIDQSLLQPYMSRGQTVELAFDQKTLQTLISYKT